MLRLMIVALVCGLLQISSFAQVSPHLPEPVRISINVPYTRGDNGQQKLMGRILTVKADNTVNGVGNNRPSRRCGCFVGLSGHSESFLEQTSTIIPRSL